MWLRSKKNKRRRQTLLGFIETLGLAAYVCYPGQSRGSATRFYSDIEQAEAHRNVNHELVASDRAWETPGWAALPLANTGKLFLGQRNYIDRHIEATECCIPKSHCIGLFGQSAHIKNHSACPPQSLFVYTNPHLSH